MERHKVVLVNKHDRFLGEMEKMEAHKKGILHRAFSVFIFNEKGEILIQQRADEKYHGATLWTNACCSHPQLNEEINNSAAQRLYFEMGLKCTITKVFEILYKIKVENNLTEHEYDHVFIGTTNACPIINPNEVKAFKWISPESLQKGIKENPHLYTSWFKLLLPKVLMHKI